MPGAVWKFMSSLLHSKNCRTKNEMFAAVMFVVTYSSKISRNLGRFGIFPSVSSCFATDFKKSCCVPILPMSAVA